MLLAMKEGSDDVDIDKLVAEFMERYDERQTRLNGYVKWLSVAAVLKCLLVTTLYLEVYLVVMTCMKM